MTNPLHHHVRRANLLLAAAAALCAAHPAHAQFTGACCRPDGSCVVSAQINCLINCGIYRGDNTTCPNDCTPQPMGACCSASSAICWGLMTPCDCGYTPDGQFAGYGTTCAICGPIRGACCFAGGSCLILDQAYCTANGGVYRGDGSICGVATCPVPCYANCDGSTTAPVLSVLDFGCFLNKFAAGDTYANCDDSTTTPVLNVLDFGCFLNKFAAGCP